MLCAHNYIINQMVQRNIPALKTRGNIQKSKATTNTLHDKGTGVTRCWDFFFFNSCTFSRISVGPVPFGTRLLIPTHFSVVCFSSLCSLNTHCLFLLSLGSLTLSLSLSSTRLERLLKYRRFLVLTKYSGPKAPCLCLCGERRLCSLSITTWTRRGSTG